jgi:hypothetical protein
MYQAHYIYLLHSSDGEGKFLRNFYEAKKELNLFQKYSIPFAYWAWDIIGEYHLHLPTNIIL